MSSQINIFRSSIKLHFIAFLVSICLTSCGDSNKVSLYNGYSFVKTDAEKFEEVSLKVKNRYESFFNYSDVQLPLFKYIKGNGYELFIAIPYEVKPDELEKLIEESKSKIEIKKSDGTTYLSYKDEDDGVFLSEAILSLNQSTLLYVSAIAESENSFDIGEIRSRFVQ